VAMSKYELLEVVGAGSFGVVHKARVKATAEIVAIKQVFHFVFRLNTDILIA
jgi:serine/threonine protein kinase